MKHYWIILSLLFIGKLSYSQDNKSLVFIGVQPSFTKEKFYSKNEFDINIIPFVFQQSLGKRIDYRLTTLANYHFGDKSQFSDLGVEFALPVFFKKKEEVSEKSKGFFLSPILEPSKNILVNHYTLTLALEGGYFFMIGESFAISTQLQYGSSIFIHNNENEKVQHFGLKVNLGFWI
jgi:hypothetical protein